MRKNQQGVSYIGILIAIIGFSFLAKIVISVCAPYFYYLVIDGQIAEFLQSSPKNISPSEFETKMEQRFDMNGIRDITFKDIAQVMNTDGLQVKKDYEIRKPFLLNIDLVLKFEKSFDQRSVQTK